MSPGLRVTFNTIFYWVGAVILLLVMAASCTLPKKYQKNKPFVYKTNINLNSNLPTSEKTLLKEALNNQLDDSTKVRTVLTIGFPNLLYYRLLKPPVFDTINIGRSKTFMTALLNSQGYFNPVITDTFSIDTLRDQQRVTVKFDVTTGVALRVDSVGFDLETSELQKLAMENRGQSVLKKNMHYSIPAVSAELDRLLTIYRDNGYYKITKEDLYAQVDTVAAGLIDPTLDPFEQVRLLQELQRNQVNPTIDVVIRERVAKDSNHLQKFYIGDVTVYPDLSILQDTMEVQKNVRMIGEYKFLFNSRKFKLPFIARNVFLKRGTLYQQSNYYKTINTFTNLGAWQQVGIDLFERYDSLPYLDATVRLYPAKKFGVSIDFETSRNTGDILTTGQLFGIGLNLGLHNRNAFHESIQTTTTLGFGVELGTRLVQTLQTSLSHNIYIPRFISPIKIKNENKLTAPTTIVNFKAAYTNRRDFFQVRSVNTSWGYNWSVKNHTWQYIPFNFEYTEVSKTDSLIKLERLIPSIRYAFNNGLIIGQILAYSKRWVLGVHSHLFRTRFEESGALFGLIKNLERNELRRFIKADIEYKYLFTRKRTGWAFRTFAGYGYVYGFTGNEPEYSLPFFKAYFAGGPYSMRAWQIRRLGPGSSKVNDPPNAKGIDRFGNMQIEGNVEYRFNVTTIYGVKVKSALFIDAGNIWGKDFDSSSVPVPIKESHFNLNRLYKDLAVGGGTGVRLDFDFFLIRLDYSFKLKNPLYADKNAGWFHDIKIGAGQFQLGIGYPF